MKRNAIFPYLLIMVLGIGLMVALSIIGVNDSKEAEGKDSEKGMSPKPQHRKKFIKNHVSLAMAKITKVQWVLS